MWKHKIISIIIILVFILSEFSAPIRSIFTSDTYSPRLENIEDNIKFIQEQLEKGMPHEGPLLERNYVVPEGMSIEEADKLWVAVAPFISLGCDENELSSVLGNISSKLPKKIGNATIDYENLKISRNKNTGEVFVEIPLIYNKELNLTQYNTTGVNKFYKVYNVTEERIYRIVKKPEGFYNITYMDLETHKNTSVITRLGVGAYSQYSLAKDEEGYFRPSEWNVLTPGLSLALVAVPGHYEDVKVAVPAQEKKFKVLFPAYDPLIFFGWLIETQISSTSISVGETFSINYSAVPVNIDPQENPLNCTLTLSTNSSAFVPLNELTRHLNNNNTSGSFLLKAITPGTYNLTLSLEGNAVFCIDPWYPYNENHRTYTLTVSGALSPSISIALAEVSTSFKYTTLNVYLKNLGSNAYNLTLLLSGNVDEVRKNIGEINSGASWNQSFTLHLRSASAGIKARVSYFDVEGNLYVSEAYITVVSKNYVVPEHYEEYTAVVPEHEETRRVFVPGYEGYTHVRLFSAMSSVVITYQMAGQSITWSYGFAEPIVSISGEGAKLEVRTSFLPISTDGFELELPKTSEELTLQALSPLESTLPPSYRKPKLPVKYVVLSISPYVELNLTVNEEEARKLLRLEGYGKINTSQVPEDYEVSLVSETTTKIPLLISEEDYLEQQKLGWPHFGKSYLEDAHEVFWNFSRTKVDAGSGNLIKLIYQPLKFTGGELVKGLVLKNYAKESINYTFRVVNPSLAKRDFEFYSEGRVEKSWTTFASELSVSPISLVQVESRVGVVEVELLKDGRIVASIELDLSSEVSKFWSEFWRGFWRGFSSKLPDIAVGLAVEGAVIAVVMFIGPVHPKLALVAANLPILLSAGIQMMRLGLRLNEYLTRIRPYYDNISKEYSNIASLLRAYNLTTLASIAEGKAELIRSNEDRIGVDIIFEDVVALGFNLTDILCFIGVIEASAEQRGESFGRIAGEALKIAVYATTIRIVDKITSTYSKVESYDSFLEYIKKGIYAYITPPVWDACFSLRRTIKGLVFLSVVSDVDEDIRKIVNVEDYEEEKIKELENVGELGLDAAEAGLSEEHSIKLLNILAKYYEYGGEEWEEKAGEFVRSLKTLSKGDLSTAIKIVDWLDDLSSEQLADAIPKLANIRYYEISDAYVEESGEKISLGQAIEEGRYLVRATTKDGKVYEWIVETTGSDRIWVSSEYYDELKGETLDKLQLISYIPEIHFPKEFSVSGHNLYLDLFRKTLLIDGREVKIVNFEENPHRIRKFGIKIETNLKSLRGTEIAFMFYDDGTVDFYINDPYRIHSLDIEPGNILVIDYGGGPSEDFQAVAPLEPKPLQVGTPIELGELSVDVEGKEEVNVMSVLKKVFGYDNFKTLQEEIENGEVGVILKFDNKLSAFCRDPDFKNIRVPEGAKKMIAVKVYPLIKEVDIEKVSEEIANGEIEYVTEYKNIKEEIESGKLNEEAKKRLEGKIVDLLGEIGEVIANVELNKRKKEISEHLGVPPERLFIKHFGESGEVDFKIYQDSDEGTLLTIVEVKTTTCERIEQLLSSAEDQLRERFMEEKYKNLEQGIEIAIFIDDVEKLLQPGENYEFKINYFKNPYKK